MTVFVWGSSWSALNKISIIHLIILIDAAFLGVLHQINHDLLAVEVDATALLFLMVRLVRTCETVLGELVELYFCKVTVDAQITRTMNRQKRSITFTDSLSGYESRRLLLYDHVSFLYSRLIFINIVLQLLLLNILVLMLLFLATGRVLHIKTWDIHMMVHVL